MPLTPLAVPAAAPAPPCVGPARRRAARPTSPREPPRPASRRAAARGPRGGAAPWLTRHLPVAGVGRPCRGRPGRCCAASTCTIEEGELALVVGRTGSGKSTLLGAMCGRVPHFTGGTLTGHVRLHGRDTRDHRPRDLADLVGVVGQDPLAGFVTDTVEEELAYGMEQLGLPAADHAQAGRGDPRPARHRRAARRRRCASCPAGSSSGWPSARCSRPTPASSCSTSRPRPSTPPAPRRCSRPSPGSCTTSPSRSSSPSTGSSGCCTTPTPSCTSRRRARCARGCPSDLMVDSDIASPWSSSAGMPGGRRCRCPCATRAARPRGLRRPAHRHPARDAATDPAAPPTPTEPDVVPRRRAASWCATPATCSPSAGVDLDLHAGEVTALMGRNGCGKSSLLWALQGSGAPAPSGHRSRATRRRPARSSRSDPGVRENVVRWSAWCRRPRRTCSTSTPSAPSASRPTARAACRAAPARGCSPRWPPASRPTSTRATSPRARSWPSCSPCS